MDNKKFIEITDEVLELFENWLSEQMKSYERIWLPEIKVLLSWIRTWIYKKIALGDENINNLNK